MTTVEVITWVQYIEIDIGLSTLVWLWEKLFKFELFKKNHQRTTYGSNKVNISNIYNIQNFNVDYIYLLMIQYELSPNLQLVGIFIKQKGDTTMENNYKFSYI